MMRKMIPLFVAMASSGSARASVEVVAQNRDSRLLHLQSAKVLAEVDAPARLGRVTETWVYSNVAKENFEGEFVCEAPQNAIMSGFAYWYRGEKVVAQIEEKERAANIYAAFNPLSVPVRFRRDPALAEKLAANRLKVRIGPIDAGKPLRIELQYIVPCDTKDGRLQLPVKLRGETPASVDKFEIASSVGKFGARWVGGQLPGAKGGALPQNIALEVTEAPPLALLQSSANSGFFAGVVSETQLKQLQNWRGVNSLQSQVLDASRVLVAGKFASVSPARFLKIATRADESRARLWWMALRLAALEGDARNYVEVVRLSRASGIPSNFTSWLAIPTSERKRMEHLLDPEKARRQREDYSRLGHALAAFKALGKTKTPQYREMLAQFQKLQQRKSDNKSDYYRTQSLSEFEKSYANNVLYYGLMAYVQEGRDSGAKLPKFKAQFARLSVDDEGSRKNFAALLQSAQKAFAARRALPVIEAQIARGKQPDYSVLRVSEQEYRNDEARQLIGRLAAQYVEVRAKNPRRAAFLRAQIAAIGKAVGQEKQDVFAIADAESTPDKQQAQRDLEAAILAGKENTPEGQRLRAQFETLKAQNEYFGRGGFDFSAQIGKLYSDRQIEMLRAQPDQSKIAALEAEEARLTKFSARSAKEIESSKRYTFNVEAGRRIATLWAQEELENGPDSPRAAMLKTKWLENSNTGADWQTHYFQSAEQEELRRQAAPLLERYWAAAARLEAGEDEAKTLESQIRSLNERALYNKTLLIEQMQDGAVWRRSAAIDAAIAEQWQQPNPDTKRLDELTKMLQASLEESEARQDVTNWTFRRFWATPSDVQRSGGAKEYARLKVERLGVRRQLEIAAKKLAATKDAPLATQLNAQNEVAELRQRDNQLKVRMGDPLIAVKAPRDCRQVIAVLPGGEIKKLEFNPLSREFEARFDVPTWASEGAFRVEILVVLPSGTRQRLVMVFGVDLRSPLGNGFAQRKGDTLQLRLETGDDTDRVSAFVGNNGRVELKREGSAFVGQTQVSSPLSNSEVRFVVTDEAHNRSEIRVALSP